MAPGRAPGRSPPRRASCSPGFAKQESWPDSRACSNLSGPVAALFETEMAERREDIYHHFAMAIARKL